MFAAALAALALSPAFGNGPGAGPQVRILEPGSLRPAAASPAFPSTTNQVERSPDGTRLAATHGPDGSRTTVSGLSFYDAQTGSAPRAWSSAGCATVSCPG